MAIRRFAFGPFTLDLEAGRLLRDGQPLAITARDLAVLRCLVVRSGQVVSTDEILDSVWGDAFVVRGVVKAALHRVRAVLGESASSARFVETIGRNGYRFIGKVRAVVSASSEGETFQDAARATASERVGALFAKARAGERQVALVGDPSPSSASQFVGSLVACVEAEGAAWCARGRCLKGSHATGRYGALVEALRSASRGPLAAEVVAVLRRHAPLWLDWISGGASEAFVRDPGRVTRELCDAVEALAAIRPFVLVLEDLHHADAATLGMISALASRRSESRLLVLATFDPELRHDASWPFEGVVRALTERSLAVELEIPAESPAPRRAQRARAPFVGRDDELRVLAQALDRAHVGAGGIGLLLGEPGIGKTRLLDEFAIRARAAGVQVLWGSCEQADLARPFGAVAEALAAHAREVPESVLREEVDGFGEIVAGIVPALRDRLEDLPAPPPLPPEEERRRIMDALVQILWSIARRAPAVLIIDDLHWADSGTLALLRHMSRFLRRHGLLVVAACRDTEIGEPLAQTLAEIRRATELAQLALEGLDRDCVAALTEGLGIETAPDGFAEALRAETQGNPFFCRELLLHLLEEGRIGPGVDPPQWELSIREAEVPEGVREVVTRRLARLPEAATRLLASASGFSGGFRFDVVAAVAELDERSGLDALDAALSAQLVRETGEPERYEFTHALVRSALYRELSSSRRLRLHRRLAKEMERVLGESAGGHALEIAEQWHRSAALPGAEAGVRHCEVAAEQAQRTGAFDAAGAALRMALELAPAGDPRRPRLEARLGLVLAWSLAHTEAVEVALRAADAIVSSEGRAAAADYLADAADAVHASAFDPRAWVLAERGLRYAEGRRDLTWARLAALDFARRDASDPDLPGIPLDDPDRVEASRILWGRCADDQAVIFGTATTAFACRADVLEHGMRWGPFAAFWAGEYVLAIALWREAAARHLERGQLASAALLLSSITRCKLALGDASGMTDEFAKAVELLHRVGAPPFMVMQLGGPNLEHSMFRGEGYERRLAGIEAALANSTGENRWISSMVQAYLALFRAHAGKTDAALQSLEALLPAIERAPGWAPNYTAILCFAIEVLWQLERTDYAELLEANLRTKTLAPDFRYAHVDARLSLARLCALTGRTEEARDWFSAARCLLDQQGARPLRAIADFDQARMELRLGAHGDSATAASLLASARERFASLGMPGWLARADALAAQR